MKKLLTMAICIGLFTGAAQADQYVRFGCANNGNGASDSCASSTGAEGAFKTLNAFLGQSDKTVTDESGPRTVNITCENCTTADSAVSISGWTTDETHYIDIVVAPSARHSGVMGTSNYRLYNSHSDTRTIRTDQGISWRMTGIQAENAGGDTFKIYSTGSGSGTIHFISSILKASATVVTNDHSSDMTLRFQSCMLFGGSHGLLASGVGSGAFEIYNNTIIAGSGMALKLSRYGTNPTFTVRNNFLFGGGNDYSTESSAGTVIVTNNACVDTTCPDANDNLDSQCTTNDECFVDDDNGDYHLKSTAEIANVGYYMSGTYSTDIDYQTRGASFDIGADEYVASGPSLLNMLNARGEN